MDRWEEAAARERERKAAEARAESERAAALNKASEVARRNGARLVAEFLPRMRALGNPGLETYEIGSYGKGTYRFKAQRRVELWVVGAGPQDNYGVSTSTLFLDTSGARWYGSPAMPFYGWSAGPRDHRRRQQADFKPNRLQALVQSEVFPTEATLVALYAQYAGGNTQPR